MNNKMNPNKSKVNNIQIRLRRFRTDKPKFLA